MKTYRLLVPLAVAGFLGIGAAAQAQTYRLNFKLTIQAQDYYREQVGNSEVYKSTVVKVKVTNKDMLKLLGVSFDSDFTGNTLVLKSGHFQVRDSSGTATVRDVTSSGVMANFDAMKGDYVLQETIDNSKDTYNGVGVCTSTIAYADLRGNHFSMPGVTQDTMKHTGGGSSYSFKFSGSGSGAIGTPPSGWESTSLFVITGTLDGKSY